MIKYEKFSSKRSFGLEFEISNTKPFSAIKELVQNYEKLNKISRQVGGSEAWDQSLNNNYWHLKTDSSCGILGNKKDKGFEICSWVGSGVKDLISIASLGTFLTENGIEVNPNCGFHVHASVKDFNECNVGIILAYWLKIENVVMNAVPASRKGNKHCKPLRRRKIDYKKTYTPLELWKLFKPTKLGIHENNQRKTAINFVNWVAYISSGGYGKPTLELRIPEGTLNFNEICCWTKFYINFLDKTFLRMMPVDLNPTNVKETLNILGLGDKNILSPGLFATKLWFLNRIIQYGHKATIVQEAKKILEFITIF